MYNVILFIYLFILSFSTITNIEIISFKTSMKRNRNHWANR